MAVPRAVLLVVTLLALPLATPVGAAEPDSAAARLRFLDAVAGPVKKARKAAQVAMDRPGISVSERRALAPEAAFLLRLEERVRETETFDVFWFASRQARRAIEALHGHAAAQPASIEADALGVLGGCRDYVDLMERLPRLAALAPAGPVSLRRLARAVEALVRWRDSFGPHHRLVTEFLRGFSDPGTFGLLAQQPRAPAGQPQPRPQRLRPPRAEGSGRRTTVRVQAPVEVVFGQIVTLRATVHGPTGAAFAPDLGGQVRFSAQAGALADFEATTDTLGTEQRWVAPRKAGRYPIRARYSGTRQGLRLASAERVVWIQVVAPRFELRVQPVTTAPDPTQGLLLALSVDNRSAASQRFAVGAHLGPRSEAQLWRRQTRLPWAFTLAPGESRTLELRVAPSRPREATRLLYRVTATAVGTGQSRSAAFAIVNGGAAGLRFERAGEQPDQGR